MDKALPCTFRWRLSFPWALYYLMNCTAFLPLLLWQHSPCLLPQHNSEAEWPINSDEATPLSISELWPWALGRGLCHPGLGLWSWFLPLLLEEWWWQPQPWEECSTWVLLLQWKRLWSKVRKDEQQVDASPQRPWSAMSIEPHDAKIEETAKHCTQRISGWRLPRWGVRKINPEN